MTQTLLSLDYIFIILGHNFFNVVYYFFKGYVSKL